MIKTSRIATTILGSAFALLLTVSQAEAHARVVGTTPKANATVSTPKTIEVHFNEAVELKFSSMKLATSTGTDIPVMNMTQASDATTLSIMPNAPLKAGAYRVSWVTVSDDGHKEHGTFNFSVK